MLAGVAAFGALLIGFFGYMIYDGFLKPPTIVGTWRGSMIEFETGHPIIHTRYDLILDDKKRAEMTLQEKYTSVGTYSLKGNRLKLSFKDDDGETTETQYKIALGRSTLDLLDPETGKLVVQLIRFREKPVVGGKPEAPPAPTELAAGDTDQIDKAADERIAAVEFSPKDSAFKLRYPQGWEPDTGSRPDNTYSWATVSHDSAKIRIIADIKGSLMSGSDSSRQHEEGSELAPVHRRARTLQEDGCRGLRRLQREQARCLQGLAAWRRPHLGVHCRRGGPVRFQAPGLPRDAADQGPSRDHPLPLPREGICKAQADLPCRLPQPLALRIGVQSRSHSRQARREPYER